MWMDRQTNMTKLLIPLRNFVNAPKNGLFHIRKKEISHFDLSVYATYNHVLA